MRRPIKLAGSKSQPTVKVKPVVEEPKVEKKVETVEEPKVEKKVETVEEPKVEEVVEKPKAVRPKPLYTQKKKSVKKETK